MNDPVKIVDRTFMNGVATAIYAVQTAEAGTAYMSVARSNHGNEKRVVIIVDAGRFRVVHACWDADVITPLRAQYPDGCIDQPFVQAAAYVDSFAHMAFNRLLRGTDMRLPDGLTLTGGDGLTRAFFRTKFWEDDPKTYGDIVFQPDALPERVAQKPLSSTEKGTLLRYPVDEPMLFVGHYWRSGEPAPIRPNLACLDYSAVLYGKLVAYRLDQETRLDPAKFVWVDVERPEAVQ